MSERVGQKSKANYFQALGMAALLARHFPLDNGRAALALLPQYRASP